MKYIYLLFCLFLIHNVQAQTPPYIFGVDQGTYTPLANGTSVNNGALWDDTDYEVPLGFNFQLFGQTTASLYLYGDYTANNVFGLPAADPSPLIISYGADLIDRGIAAASTTSQSPISYTLQGTPGQRIFKMEWANAGFYGSADNDAFTNLQLWIFEGTNDIELHFGPTQTNDEDLYDDFTGPLMGFMNSYGFQSGNFNQLWYLSGSIDNPTLEFVTPLEIDTLTQTLLGAPGDGLIYRFRPTGVVGTKDPGTAYEVKVFPTIVSDFVTLAIAEETVAQDNDLQYSVTDLLGRTVRSGSLTAATMQVDLSGLSTGMYAISVVAPSGVLASKKLLKQ